MAFEVTRDVVAQFASRLVTLVRRFSERLHDDALKIARKLAAQALDA